MKNKFSILTILGLLIISFSAMAQTNSQPNSDQLKACYVAGYKNILVDIMGLNKGNTGYRKYSDDEYQAGLNKTIIQIGKRNGVFSEVYTQDRGMQIVARKVSSPKGLIGMAADENRGFTSAGLERKIGYDVFLNLGAYTSTVEINKALGSGKLTEQIKALPECAGIF